MVLTRDNWRQYLGVYCYGYQGSIPAGKRVYGRFEGAFINPTSGNVEYFSIICKDEETGKDIIRRAGKVWFNEIIYENPNSRPTNDVRSQAEAANIPGTKEEGDTTP